MTTLSEFHTLISGEINKGTRYDTAIPTYVKRAARFIERNYNFLYMERFLELDLDVSVENPRFVAFPSTLTKKINFVRYASPVSGSNQQQFVYLARVDPIDMLTVEPEASPLGYWLTGDDSGATFMVLDQIGDQNITFDVHTVAFTVWPTAASAEHWLLDNAEEVLTAQTMRLMAPYANEPDWKLAYKEMWEEGIRTLTMADEDNRAAGTADGYKMVFR